MSLVATLRAHALSPACNCSVIQTLVSRSPSPFCFPLRRLETRDTEAGPALLQPTHHVYIQQINTNMAGRYEILPEAWTQQRLPSTHKHTQRQTAPVASPFTGSSAARSFRHVAETLPMCHWMPPNIKPSFLKQSQFFQLWLFMTEGRQNSHLHDPIFFCHTFQS